MCCAPVARVLTFILPLPATLPPPARTHSWYFYQKTKNYRVAWAGIKGGLRTGARLGLWTGAFLGCEEAVDRAIRTGLDQAGVHDPQNVKSKWVSATVSGAALSVAAGWYCTSFLLSPLSLWRGSPAPDSFGSFFFGPSDQLHRASSLRRLVLGMTMGAAAGAAIDLRDWLRAKLPAPEPAAAS